MLHMGHWTINGEDRIVPTFGHVEKNKQYLPCGVIWSVNINDYPDGPPSVIDAFNHDKCAVIIANFLIGNGELFSRMMDMMNMGVAMIIFATSPNEMKDAMDYFMHCVNEITVDVDEDEEEYEREKLIENFMADTTIPKNRILN